VLGSAVGSGPSRAGSYRVLTAAIGEGDPETSRAAAERVLRASTDALLTALDAVAGR
jgi:GntR family transcriptional regulator, transcriptional repressor for pyruvate dehydrogenase complex